MTTKLKTVPELRFPVPRAKGPAPYQPRATPKVAEVGKQRAESPSHRTRIRAWIGLSALGPFSSFPGALPQAGMDAGLWPSVHFAFQVQDSL